MARGMMIARPRPGRGEGRGRDGGPPQPRSAPVSDRPRSQIMLASSALRSRARPVRRPASPAPRPKMSHLPRGPARSAPPATLWPPAARAGVSSPPCARARASEGSCRSIAMRCAVRVIHAAIVCLH